MADLDIDDIKKEKGKYFNRKPNYDRCRDIFISRYVVCPSRRD